MDLIEIIDLVRKEDYFNCGETVEIAKGLNEYPTSLKDVFKKIKRFRKYKIKEDNTYTYE
jgi:hypothetical protein